MSGAVGFEPQMERWVSAGGEADLASGVALPTLLGAAAKGPFYFEIGARQPRTRPYPEGATYLGSEVRDYLLRVGSPERHRLGGPGARACRA